MQLLERFLSPESISLKICGVRTREDADQLAALGVDALGVNFWPHSKRFLPADEAVWLRDLAGVILRVGLFVNHAPELPLRLIREGLIDVVQVHGDETPNDVEVYRQEGVPFFRGIGVKSQQDLMAALDYRATALLLDAHAPGVYGGTGETFDWNTAVEFQSRHPDLPVILAGGIVPENAAAAAAIVRPCALDVASGAELAPGIKDFKKVAALLAALNR